MSTPNDTLREIHERCKARHGKNDLGWALVCSRCREPEPWPCPDYTDAVAALRILNEAEVQCPDTVDTGMGGREPVDEVYTPEGAAIYRAARTVRLVPDPGGRAAPPPTTTTP